MVVPADPELWARAGSIALQREGRERVLCLAGEVDGAVVEAFELGEGAQPVPVDAIDAGRVTFIASRGIGLMLRWHQLAVASGRTATLRSSSPCVRRVLQLCGLGDAFA
jgi:anti-anti-sigma factor